MTVAQINITTGAAYTDQIFCIDVETIGASMEVPYLSSPPVSCMFSQHL
jgi:hypothetical protein